MSRAGLFVPKVRFLHWELSFDRALDGLPGLNLCLQPTHKFCYDPKRFSRTHVQGN
jgi:hypothetical protein